jgi:putative colanic acid biosynthesis acetyltransferase WcaF
MPFQDLSKFKLPEGFRGKAGWKVQLWWIVQVVFFKSSPQFMYGWRRFILRCFGARIGKRVIIRPSAHFQFPWKISIGDNSWIGNNVVLYSLGEIKIGKNAVISQKSYLCAGTHDYRKESFPIYTKSIIIENECWLATDVFVAPGVTIGEGTVVGARSSVFTSLPPHKICFGTPARIVKERKSNAY